jgi:uncharacterized protein with HEPN domain
VDAEEVWQIIKNDLPTLKNAIKKILRALLLTDPYSL